MCGLQMELERLNSANEESQVMCKDNTEAEVLMLMEKGHHENQQ